MTIAAIAIALSTLVAAVFGVLVASTGKLSHTGRYLWSRSLNVSERHPQRLRSLGVCQAHDGSGGEIGVFSARYLKENKTQKQKGMTYCPRLTLQYNPHTHSNIILTIESNLVGKYIKTK
jgi:hypothetical protein